MRPALPGLSAVCGRLSRAALTGIVATSDGGSRSTRWRERSGRPEPVCDKLIFTFRRSQGRGVPRLSFRSGPSPHATCLDSPEKPPQSGLPRLAHTGPRTFLSGPHGQGSVVLHLRLGPLLPGPVLG